MNTTHFPLNLQYDSTLSELRNFGGGFNPQTPLGTPLISPPSFDLSTISRLSSG